MNTETKKVLETGTLEDLDLLLFEIKEALATRNDIKEVTMLLDSNGVLLEMAADNFKICGKKRPH